MNTPIPQTNETAYVAMYGRFYAAFEQATQMILGYVPFVEKPGQKVSEGPDLEKHWARFNKSNVLETQSTLSSDVEKIGGRRFTVDGLIIVQLFCPRADDLSFQQGMLIAQAIKNAFRSADYAGSIWYYNAAIKDGLDPEPAWHRFNVVVEFQYDELQ